MGKKSHKTISEQRFQELLQYRQTLNHSQAFANTYATYGQPVSAVSETIKKLDEMIMDYLENQ